MKGKGNLSFWSVYKNAHKGSEMHFMGVKTERSEIRQMTQYLIILHMGAVLERILFLEKNAMISIGGFHASSGDTNNNGEMNKCWWTNKAS